MSSVWVYRDLAFRQNRRQNYRWTRSVTVTWWIMTSRDNRFSFNFNGTLNNGPLKIKLMTSSNLQGWIVSYLERWKWHVELGTPPSSFYHVHVISVAPCTEAGYKEMHASRENNAKQTVLHAYSNSPPLYVLSWLLWYSISTNHNFFLFHFWNSKKVIGIKMTTKEISRIKIKTFVK